MEEYFVFSETLNINLKSGCLFRCRGVKTQEIGGKPVRASAMTDRLKTHLSAIKLYECESSHSSRPGYAITLRMLGMSDSMINGHMGWNSGGMTDHYARVGELYGQRGVARRLSDAAGNSRGVSELCKISRSVNSLRNLRRFYFSKMGRYMNYDVNRSNILYDQGVCRAL